jgi:pimeloyl-ACP methyl ester carboxylesterase
VLLLDLPGHGQSPEQPSYPADHVADLVHGAVEQAGLRAPVLVGHSIGRSDRVDLRKPLPDARRREDVRTRPPCGS